ncbi:hypothetical protein B7463_g8802, partial [Scytalidium lignicola]
MTASITKKSTTYIPLAGYSNDGWSKEDEATATCICGAVQLAFSTQDQDLVKNFICHCTDCRKITASMFASNFTVADVHVKHLRGQDNLKAFSQSRTIATGNTITNYFCSTCGTLMYRASSGFPGLLFMRIGTVDDFNLHETKLKPHVEQFVDDRVGWLLPVGGVKQVKGMSTSSKGLNDYVPKLKLYFHQRFSSVLRLPFSTMSEIVHPTIKDGWFREISDMWPGQAMTLKVEKVIHHEKSKYQDVLIFKSTDYGMVLVLDNVIQCTERDEFAYQEMITHLAMNSHPSPKRVLVIGGGDGGVLREVVKHECVEEAILCDIDEAVIRLSKQYLPGMSVGFDHPKVKTHIGDGFKFLNDYKNAFDVIITDSSDPEGPAESLFQKPYFELLHGALREGGVITTQGSENQWLHLPLITKLKKDCKEVFPNVEYAYTTIPTYPSGQIGFMVCCKDATRNLKSPLRSWTSEEESKLCKYYNADIHKASFVLPTFAREALQ